MSVPALEQNEITPTAPAPTAPEPLVYVVVLNYNGRMHLEYCLPSLLATDYPNLRILFVDNDSADGSYEYARENFPQLEFLQTGANLGWAGGNNAGIRYALAKGAAYVCLANNDIRVHPQWVRGALAAFALDPLVRLASGVVHGDMRPAPLAEFTEASAAWQTHRAWFAPEYLSGMALFVDVRLFAEIGWIDEVYFAYCEETDLQMRAEKAGLLRARYNVPVWHYSSGTFARHKLRAARLTIRNNIRLALKQYPPVRILKAVLNVFYIGCFPVCPGDRADVTVARLRPRNIVLNLLLDLEGVVWNLLHLRQTLTQRREDRARIAAVLAARAARTPGDGRGGACAE